MVGLKILDLAIMVRIHGGQPTFTLGGLKDNMVWYVYILECQNKDLYTGITNNLKRRFKAHKSGKGAKFTRAFIAEKILYSEKYPTKCEALKREAQIKRWERKKKLALVGAD